MSGFNQLSETALVDIATGLKNAGSLMMLGIGGSSEMQSAIDPGVPVIKVAGNPDKVQSMGEHVDVDAGSIIAGTRSVNEVGHIIFDRIMQVASGDPVAAETHQYDRTIGIYTLGPTV